MVTDTLPAGTTFAGYATTLPHAFAQPAAGTLAWNFGALAGSASATITVEVVLSPTLTLGSLLTNEVEASTTATETVTANNTAQTVTQVGAPDLGIVKEGPALVNAGDTVTFTISYSNSGTLAATGVVLTDRLPSGMSYVADSGGGNHVDGLIAWDIGGLAVGAQGAVVVTATAEIAGQYTNTAQIRCSQTDTNAANDRADLPVTISGAELYVTKTGPSLLIAGEVATYTITFGNTGDQPADLTLTDLFPTGFTSADIAADTSGLAFTDTATSRTWTATGVAGGSSLSFTLAFTTPSSLADGLTLTNTITLTTTAAGNDPTNDEAHAPAPTGIRIHTIQGAAHISPKNGQMV